MQIIEIGYKKINIGLYGLYKAEISSSSSEDKHRFNVTLYFDYSRVRHYRGCGVC